MKAVAARSATAVLAATLSAMLFGAGCSRAVEADCQRVGPGVLAQIQPATASYISEGLAVPSRTQKNVWLVGARTDRGVAVWSVSLPPDGEGLSFVLNANDAAREDSVVGTDVPPDSDQPEAVATHDKVGIAAAEACFTEG